MTQPSRAREIDEMSWALQVFEDMATEWADDPTEDPEKVGTARAAVEIIAAALEARAGGPAKDESAGMRHVRETLAEIENGEVDDAYAAEAYRKHVPYLLEHPDRGEVATNVQTEGVVAEGIEDHGHDKVSADGLSGGGEVVAEGWLNKAVFSTVFWEDADPGDPNCIPVRIVRTTLSSEEGT